MLRSFSWSGSKSHAIICKIELPRNYLLWKSFRTHSSHHDMLFKTEANKVFPRCGRGTFGINFTRRYVDGWGIEDLVVWYCVCSYDYDQLDPASRLILLVRWNGFLIVSIVGLKVRAVHWGVLPGVAWIISLGWYTVNEINCFWFGFPRLSSHDGYLLRFNSVSISPLPVAVKIPDNFRLAN